MSLNFSWDEFLRGGLPAVLDYPNSGTPPYFPVGYPVEQLPAEHAQTVPATSYLPTGNNALMIGGGLLVLVAVIALVMKK